MKTDVAIIGGGPGGAAQSMFLAPHGVKSTIIEMDQFPRYHIGESMSGECGAIIRTLGLEDYMLGARWPRKQGVRVYGESKIAWWVPVMQRTGEMELKEQETWQVRRDDFDDFMLKEAERRGATIVRGKAVDVVRGEAGTVRAVRVKMADGGEQMVECEALVDASGQKNFLAHAGVSSPKQIGRYDKQIAIFSQFAHAIRDHGTDRVEHPDNTLIFYSRQYHWAWSIPINHEIVSIGVVVPAAYFLDKRESKKDFLLRELRELHPELSRRLPDLTPVEEVRAIPNYSYYVNEWTGKNWLCIGDSHRFIDPIFSFGLYLSMKEAERATEPLVQYLNGTTRDLAKPFDAHERSCTMGVDRLQDLIDGFWSSPLAFAFLVNGSRTRFEMVDLFAGRIYDEGPPNTVQRELKLLCEKAPLMEAT